MNWQAFCGLHHPQHHLARDAALLGQTETAQLCRQLSPTFGADRGQVVEDDRQFLIDQRAQQRGQRRLQRLGAVAQGIHRAQQVLMRHRLGRNFRHQNPFEPAQDAQFRLGVAQPVEHHDPQQPFGIELTAIAQYAAEGISKAELLPQRRQQPGVTHRARRGETRFSRPLVQRRLAGRTQQPIDQRVRLTGLDRFQAAKGGDDMLARYAGLVAKGFDELDVLTRTRSSDLHEHVATVSLLSTTVNTVYKKPCHYRSVRIRKLSCCFYEKVWRTYGDIIAKVSNSGYRHPSAA